MNLIARCLSALVLFAGLSLAEEPAYIVGVAEIDITPDYPVRLSGYGNRREEFEEVAQRIWAKALAIGGDAAGPAVLVTVDNCGTPASMREELLTRLARRTKLAPERFAICFSHTHCAPCLTGSLPNIFSSDIPPEHQQRIDRYSRELTDKIEQVVLAALADRKPARLAWAQGTVNFARNRRVAWGGPVDWALPALFVTAPDGKLRAVFANYACHATTLQYNKISGDWPGYAMEAIERDHPGGCGADQNPHPRGTVELARQHGEAFGAEVTRLLASTTPVRGALVCREKSIDLPFDALPTRDEWLALAQSKSANIAYHARRNLARLDRGEKLPTSVPYLVQTWSFGRDIAMVFLPGEVVVDFALRLKAECDASRLWVNAYANDATCYIPSRRVLAEGGYEGAGAMVYYDRPTKFAPGIEDRVIGAVHELLPKGFAAKTGGALSPADSWAAIKPKDGLVVSLVVAEPMVVSPVAIDWSADGRLWVAEMRDYPSGPDGKFTPGGAIKVLEDTDADGRYDKATEFLAGLPFPTGVTAWGRGVLICAAPDIILAEDTNGDGRADSVKKLFSGFLTDNYQARVNSLSLGLDNWIHGANGLLGGSITSFAGGPPVDIRGRDFRMNPATGAFEPASGVSQQGRARDDWGNWFGCSNGRLAFHFPLREHYGRRNPHVPAPPSQAQIPAAADPNVLHPISIPPERFNNPESLNHTTSACGLGIYRDDLIPGLAGDIFTCEPVHNLVHRLKLTPRSATFDARRAPDEQTSEFLASTDNWFRPVQVRTGPDGALWVVDMYRAVIEHPRWIPGDKLATLDVRAGARMGRIYRIHPANAKLRPIRDLTKLATPELVAALDTPNGTTRDLAHAELLRRPDAAAELSGSGALAASADAKRRGVASTLPAVRVQALCVLDGLRAITPELLAAALADTHPAVRRHAIRLSEPNLAPCLPLVDDPDFTVRHQLALSLGEWDDPRAAAALAAIAKSAPDDEWMRAAVLSSAARQSIAILTALGPGPDELIGGLVATAAAKAEDIGTLIRFIAPAPGAGIEPWQIVGLARLQDTFDRRKGDSAAVGPLASVYEAAHRFANDAKTDPATRLAAIRLYGRGLNDQQRDLPLLASFIAPTADAAVQKAALDTLSRSRSPLAPGIMLAAWPQHGPAMRVAIINALLSRDEGAIALLDAIGKATVVPADVPTASRERLAKHANKAIRERAAKLLPSARPGDRAAVVAKYQPVANLTGDAAKGATVFKNICATCHAYLGQGSEIGPNIGTYRTKSVQDFLVAILDPNAVVEPRYSTYTAELKDGRALVGVISSESATTLVLSQPGGVRETILRSDIAALRASPLSLMPEGLDHAIPPQDMADLIAYLKGGG
ncbi:MAG: neutral/alkaline non-lysosomal ceramidase N-terminal domain-containing protein [Chthoniobacteraceae bacterium]